MHACMYVCAHMRICMCVYIISPRIKLVPLVSFRTLPDPSSALAHDDMHLAAHQALLAVLRDGKHTCTILSGDATQAAFRREFIVIHGGISSNIMGFYGAYWDAYQILWYIFWEGGLSENGLYQIKGRVGENPGSKHQQVPFFKAMRSTHQPTHPHDVIWVTFGIFTELMFTMIRTYDHICTKNDIEYHP